MVFEHGNEAVMPRETLERMQTELARLQVALSSAQVDLDTSQARVREAETRHLEELNIAGQMGYQDGLAAGRKGMEVRIAELAAALRESSHQPCVYDPSSCLTLDLSGDKACYSCRARAALADSLPAEERVLSPSGVLHDLLAVRGCWAWIRVAEDNGSNHPYTVRLAELTRAEALALLTEKGEGDGGRTTSPRP